MVVPETHREEKCACSFKKTWATTVMAAAAERSLQPCSSLSWAVLVQQHIRTGREKHRSTVGLNQHLDSVTFLPQVMKKCPSALH